MTRSPVRKRIRWILLVFWTLVILWMGWNMQAHDVDPAILQSSADIRVTPSDHMLSFEPVMARADTNSVGLVFYPGALVDPEAYAPIARAVAVADAGYPVHIIHVPWRLAPLDGHETTLFDRTLAHITSDPGRQWVVGGHSRGGALAADFAALHADRLSGLLLVGTSHPRDVDLSGLPVPVLKIFASADGLASPAEIETFAGNLPPSTTFVRIEGGNHSQFGSYGWQLGAGSATIDQASQQQQTIQAVVQFLEQIGQ